MKKSSLLLFCILIGYASPSFSGTDKFNTIEGINDPNDKRLKEVITLIKTKYTNVKDLNSLSLKKEDKINFYDVEIIIANDTTLNLKIKRKEDKDKKLFIEKETQIDKEIEEDKDKKDGKEKETQIDREIEDNKDKKDIFPFIDKDMIFLISILNIIGLATIFFTSKNKIKILEDEIKSLENKADKNYVSLSLQKWSEPITEKITKNAQNIIVLNNNHKKLRESIDEKISNINKTKSPLFNSLEKETQSTFEEVSPNPFEKRKTHYEIMIEDFEDISSRDFIDNYNGEKLDIANSLEVLNYGDEIKFISGSSGKYIAIPKEDSTNKFYVFHTKDGDIKIDRAIKQVFTVPDDSEEGKSYSGWRIKRPAMLSKDGDNYSIMQKGIIEI